MVLAVKCSHTSQFLHAFQDLKGLPVIQAPVIGQVYLHAGHSIFHHSLQLVQNILVHMLGSPVKSIVNHSLTVSQMMVFIQLVMKIAAIRSKSHVVHNGSGTSAGRRHRTVIKVIY